MSLAAAHMDSMYRHQRHFYDATRKFYLLGRDDLIRELQPPAGGTALEIGCGTARNLALAARAYPTARLYGVDVSAEMLATARKNIDAAKIDDRTRVACADGVDFDPNALFGLPKFDRVFISYALSMIPPWREALAHSFDLVAPNGSLHIVDFGDFNELPGWFGAGMRKWLGAFSVTPRNNLESELAALAESRAMTSHVVRRFRGYAIHAVVGAAGTIGGGVSNDRGSRLFEQPQTGRA